MSTDESSKTHGDKLQTPKRNPTETGSKSGGKRETPAPHAHPADASDKIHGDKLDTTNGGK